MLIIISPAKIQNLKNQTSHLKHTLPVFTDEAEQLVKKLRTFSKKELADLLHVNSKIASDAADRFYNWTPEHSLQNAKQAILVYAGEVYRGLDAYSLSEQNIIYAQKHLRMLSGLYGVLRPLDLIHGYRLEMNTKLTTATAKNLYEFWNEKITGEIINAIKESGNPQILLNLASNEYFKSLNIKGQGIRVLNFEFLENKDGIYKPITVYTKKARGLLTRFIIKNQINDIELIKGFDSEGYWFNPQLSDNDNFVFARG